MADRQLTLRQKWIRTLWVDGAGIALVVIGLVAGNGAIVFLGLALLVAALIYRVFFGLYFPRRRQKP
jgi:hypothetical protein